jgi:epoxyqueuosine reductase
MGAIVVLHDAKQQHSEEAEERSASVPDTHELTATVKALAMAAGFDAVGIAHAEVLQPERERYLRWVEEGRQGEMRWITPEWVTKATDPSALLSPARSIVCVALSYAGPPVGPTPPGHGRVARYAWGRDYHAVLGERLRQLSDGLKALGGTARPFVDTAPTMDKALAVRAGLGWQGRNTNVLNQKLGSFVYLGGVITDLELESDEPVPDGCGSCRLCVRACPTGALKGDYTIDARLCISYLTIEHRGPIPRALRPLMGDWVFGCDICQDVCPVVTSIQDRAYPQERQKRIKHVQELVRFAAHRRSQCRT